VIISIYVGSGGISHFLILAVFIFHTATVGVWYEILLIIVLGGQALGEAVHQVWCWGLIHVLIGWIFMWGRDLEQIIIHE
jgi:hypothetical protein